MSRIPKGHGQDLMTIMSGVRALVPLKTLRVVGLMHVEFVEAQNLPVEVMRKFGEGLPKLRCPLRQTTMIQNCKVHRQ
ncbi:hypothetical protein TNCV_3761061 [Trichonephila clavipes]|nr:hypothetical protein TNCV_3761061 [Trichonephila clavipes]